MLLQNVSELLLDYPALFPEDSSLPGCENLKSNISNRICKCADHADFAY
jgi:hypothetical protein